jgi:hypothetical protein
MSIFLPTRRLVRAAGFRGLCSASARNGANFLLEIRDPETLPQGQRGVTVLLVVAFMGLFLLIMGGLTSYAFEQAKYGRALLAREQALHVAEAGLEYYRWFLGHNPGNLTNGTGLAGPYTYTVTDPETSATIGTASVSVTGNSQCGQIQTIDLTSKGTASGNSGYPRTLSARYMQTSVAAYSYVINSNVWAFSDRNITGNYISNYGIRMDGTNNSYVMSPLTTWDCTSTYGCSPEQPTANGVTGSGSGTALWKWGSGVSSVSFANMGASFLSSLKTYAQTQGGLYFAPLSGSVTQRGYHLIFNSDGTVTVKTVTSTVGVPSYSTTHGWGIPGWDSSGYPPLYEVIGTETSGTTYTIPSSCSLIFVNDRAWVEGTVKGKVTVVVGSTTADAYIPNNITYATNDGTSGLTLIASGGVLLTLMTPDTMTLHGIFVATGGAYERPQYTANYYGCPYDVNCVSSSYTPYAIRTKLTTEGSVISNLTTGTQWGSGASTVSGYQTRVDAYDQLQATNPPPFTPVATSSYSFFLWKEI